MEPAGEARHHNSSGETDLKVLLQSMSPELVEGEYVFCRLGTSVAEQEPFNDWSSLGKDVVGMFREKEGLTVIVSREFADAHGLSYTFIAGWITLTVHSSLEACGLTAAFANALAGANISCNVVAAFYHDHIFVPIGDANRAMAVLRQLATGNEAPASE